MSEQNDQEPNDQRRARDGTMRGLVRKNPKNRATMLLEEMQVQIQARYGIVNFDPVVMLALIGVEAAMPRPVLDHKGRQVWKYTKNTDGVDEILLDDEGDRIPEMLPPDLSLSINALGKAAPYVRSLLRSIEVTDGDDGPIDADVTGAKQRFLALARKNPELAAEILDDTIDHEATPDT